VETRLARGGADLLRLELGQDYDVQLGRFGETFVGADLAWHPLSLSASARAFAFEERPYAAAQARIPSSFLDRFTELRASAALSDKRGDNVHAGFGSVAAGASASLLAGIDPLFELRPSAIEPSAGASAGARVVWSGATLGYDVLLYGRDGYVATCNAGGGERRVEAGSPQQHVATAVWNSPCRCFRILAVGRLNDCGEPSGSVILDLSHLAEARAVR
jgi:LPS-assembly protein